MKNIKKVLKDTFGFNFFKEGQEEIVKSIISKNDTLVFMPTGWWKSLTYQLPWLVFKWVTIVISPLIALMKDQVDSLRELWIRAELINSTISGLEQAWILNELSIKDNNIKFLYIAPERLNSFHFIRIIKNIKVSLIAIDEAHCVSQWGHDFRPSYMKIKTFIEDLKKENDLAIVALTATATKKVRKDIVKGLWLNSPKIITKWFDRKNIILIVREISKTKEKNAKLKEIIDSTSWSWIVYCSSRKKVKEVYEFLLDEKVSVWKYTWEMNAELREKEQNNFMNSKYKVIVATNAFGMWIDKKDIRFIVHYNLPGSIENYYQEVWRAWRDDKKSFAVVLASYWDTKIQEFFIENTYPEKEEIIDFYNYLFKDLRIWEWKWKEILKTYWVMAKESKVWNDMKVWTIIKVLEKYSIIKRWYKSELDNFRWRWLTIIKWKKEINDLEIDWERQELLKEEWYYKLEQIKKFLFYPSCRKRFILEYFWDEEDLQTLWENCKTCDYCIEKQNYKSWKTKRIVQLSVFSIVLDIINEYDKRFWVKFITSFLRWSKDKRIIEWNLDKKENYWILSEYNVWLIEALIEALLKQGFIEKTLWQYPTIWLTSKWKVSLTRDYLLKEEDNDLQSYLNMRSKSFIYKGSNKTKKVKKEKKDTYKETLKLFKKGLSLKDISKKRELKLLTIENHILSLYEDSELNLSDIIKLINFSNIEFIKDIINNDFLWNIDKLKPIKEKLEELWRKDISYFEIKVSIAMINKRDL